MMTSKKGGGGAEAAGDGDPCCAPHPGFPGGEIE